MFPNSVLLDRQGFCIFGWKVEAHETGTLAWCHTIDMEAPIFRGNYKDDTDSIHTEVVEYMAYGAHPGHGSPLCFAQRPKPKTAPSADEVSK